MPQIYIYNTSPKKAWILNENHSALINQTLLKGILKISKHTIFNTITVCYVHTKKLNLLSIKFLIWVLLFSLSSWQTKLICPMLDNHDSWIFPRDHNILRSQWLICPLSWPYKCGTWFFIYDNNYRKYDVILPRSYNFYISAKNNCLQLIVNMVI